MKYIISREFYQNLLASCAAAERGWKNKEQAIIKYLNETCGLRETITEIVVD